MGNVGWWEEELRCRYEGCGKVCRNKAGLVMHEKRMQRVNEERGRLKCGVDGPNGWMGLTGDAY